MFELIMPDGDNIHVALDNISTVNKNQKKITFKQDENYYCIAGIENIEELLTALEPCDYEDD